MSQPQSNTTGTSAGTSGTPLRRSSRRTQRDHAALPRESIRGLPITAFRRPWVQHYIDMGHCRLAKCTKRVQEAPEKDIQNLSVSFLAMAIKASSAYGPKARQERALIEYTQAVIARGIPPIDSDEQLGSALAMAAYFGYPKLLKVLLDTGTPLFDDSISYSPTASATTSPHALRAAVKNTQHDCLQIILRERPQQVKEQLHKESLATWPVQLPTTLKVAMAQGDVTSVRLLQQHNAKVLVLFRNNNKAKWTKVLKQLYPNNNNNNNNNNTILHWTPDLHWSFPGADRRIINWLWHAIQRQRDNRNTANHSQPIVLLPQELWLKVFSFFGRGWWTLSTLKDQNGYQSLPSCMK